MLPTYGNERMMRKLAESYAMSDVYGEDDLDLRVSKVVS